MNPDALAQDLANLGLSEKEALLYVTLIKAGISTVNEISDTSGIKRSSIYPIVDSLKEKGLVSTVEDTKVQKLIATDPDILTKIAQRALKKEEEKLERIEHILPELKGVHKDTECRPKVRVLEGVEGLTSALDETLVNEEKLIRTFTSGETLLELIPEYMMKWSERRLQEQIEIFSIFVENESSRIIAEMSPSNASDVFVQKDNYPFPVDAMIWDQKVGYLIVEEDIVTTIILEGEETSLLMKNMFDMAFEQAKVDGGRFLKM